MGSVQSYLSSQTTTVVLVVAGAITYGVANKILHQHQFQPPSPQAVADSAQSPGPSTSTSKKSKKKKQSTGAPSQSSTATSPQGASSNVKPNIVAFPEVIPGGFEPSPSPFEAETSSAPKATKSKKKKGKKAGAGGSRNLSAEIDVQSDSSATAPESHVSTTSRPKRKSPAPKSTPASTSLLDTDGPWTRVEPRKRQAPQQPQQDQSTLAVGEGPGGVTTTTSDAGVTTSVTGNSSPVADRTEDESHSRQPTTSENRRTLAEKLVPKPRKTGVDELSIS